MAIDGTIEERRSKPRKKTVYYFDVYDWNSDKLMGHVVDLTKEGMMIISDEELPKDTVFQLKMILPFEMDGIKQITFDAKSAWSAKDANPGYYNIGFKFTEISEEDVERIEHILEAYTFKD